MASGWRSDNNQAGLSLSGVYCVPCPSQGPGYPASRVSRLQGLLGGGPYSLMSIVVTLADIFQARVSKPEPLAEQERSKYAIYLAAGGALVTVGRNRQQTDNRSRP